MKIMNVWRLESGILSMVLFLSVISQSGLLGIFSVKGESAAGFLVAFGLLSSGIASTILWKDKSKGGDISLIVQYGVTALIGFTSFDALGFWALWALLCASVAAYSWYLNNSKVDDEEVFDYETPQSISNTAQKECPNCHAIVDVNSVFCGSCGQKIPKQSFCKNCGNPLEPEALFCPKCGARQG